MRAQTWVVISFVVAMLGSATPARADFDLLVTNRCSREVTVEVIRGHSRGDRTSSRMFRKVVAPAARVTEQVTLDGMDGEGFTVDIAYRNAAGRWMDLREPRIAFEGPTVDGKTQLVWIENSGAECRVVGVETLDFVRPRATPVVTPAPEPARDDLAWANADWFLLKTTTGGKCLSGAAPVAVVDCPRPPTPASRELLWRHDGADLKLHSYRDPQTCLDRDADGKARVVSCSSATLTFADHAAIVAAIGGPAVELAGGGEGAPATCLEWKDSSLRACAGAPKQWSLVGYNTVSLARGVASTIYLGVDADGTTILADPHPRGPQNIWQVVAGPDGTSFRIKTAGLTIGAATTLTAASGGVVQLTRGGTTASEFVITRASPGADVAVLQAKIGGPRRILSTSGSNVDLWSEDDKSGRQQWSIAPWVK